MLASPASSSQTFRAATPRDALAKVKAALGPDAVILSTREVGGLFGRAELEITASAGGGTAHRGPVARHSVVMPMSTDGHPLQRAGGFDEPAAEPMPSAYWTGAVTSLAPGGVGVTRLSERLVEELREGGVAGSIARELVQGAETASGAGRPHLFREQVCQVMARRLVTGPAPWLEAGRAVLALVGPTGVGKTTSLAKMAAHARLHGRAVVLITTDTYRVGAVDAFSRYGDILGIRCLIARSRDELVDALAQTARYSLVLVDTAGRTEAAALQRQAALLAGHAGLRVFLALSAVGTHRDVTSVCQRYGVMNPAGVLVTKLDEAQAPGSLLSADLSGRCPLVGIADGQNIPEDLHPADALRVVERVLP